MEIIDSQTIQPEPVGGWPDDMDQGAKDTLSLQLALTAMDAAGVDAGVIAVGAPSFAEFEQRWRRWRPRGVISAGLPSYAELAFTRHPRQFAAIVTVTPNTPDVVEFVSGLRHRSANRFSPGWLGIRLVLSWPPTGEELEKLRAGAYEPIFDAAERHHVPTCVFLSGDLQEAVPIAKAHPDLVLIIDHFGMKAPPMMHYDNPPFRQLDLLLQLSQFPNVAVKFSGAPALSRETYPFADLWPSLHKVVYAFGPERLMWGADYPRPKGLHTYAEAVNYLRYTTELSERDKELIFGVTLRRIMRWPRQL